MYISVLIQKRNILKIKIIFSSMSDDNEEQERRHPTYYFWLLESLLGLTGAILNYSVLYIFYYERQNLISAVNVMTRHAFDELLGPTGA